MSYAQDARDVDAAFRADGQLITLTRKQPGTYQNGAVVAPDPITATVWGIEMAVTSRDMGAANAAGTLVVTGDRKLMISTFAATGGALPEPQLEDLITAGGKTYTVRNVDALQPGGVPVMFTLIGKL